MSFHLSWGPEDGFVTIVTKNALEALILSSEYEAKGRAPTVLLDDGTAVTPFELEVMASSAAAVAH